MGSWTLNLPRHLTLGGCHWSASGRHHSKSPGRLFLFCFPGFCFWLRELWLQRMQRWGLYLMQINMLLRRWWWLKWFLGPLLQPDAPLGWSQCRLFSLCPTIIPVFTKWSPVPTEGKALPHLMHLLSFELDFFSWSIRKSLLMSRLWIMVPQGTNITQAC